MKHFHTRNFLVRNIPIEVYSLLEETARKNNRSRNQEAIVALTNGLKAERQPIERPKPLKWKTKISRKFIERAIAEGRE